MHLWQQLIRKAETDGIGSDPDAAREFFHSLPFQAKQRFVWTDWSRHFDALLWLADQRSRGIMRERLPESVDVTLTRVLSRTRVGIQRFTSFNSETPPVTDWNVRLHVKVTRRDGRIAKHIPYEDVVTFWQSVFLSFFAPEHLTGFHGVCGDCGNLLPRTKALGKISRAELCGKCRVKKYRQENRDLL